MANKYAKKIAEILTILGVCTGIGGAIGMLGGPIGAGIGATAGFMVGAGIILTTELINKYQLKIQQLQAELDDSDTQSSEESEGIKPTQKNIKNYNNEHNNENQHKPLSLAKAKESLSKLTSKLGLHKHKDPLFDGFTEEENILKPIKLGKL